MSSGKVIAFHSYKGGTGKTTCIVNLAALYAKMGKKVCLIDFDLYAPSLSTYFNKTPDYFLHNLLAGDVDIYDVLVDYKSKLQVPGELKIVFSSPNKDAIQSIEMNFDENFQLKALREFLGVKKRLLEHENFDYIFIDTSPGIRHWSINALAATDILFIMLKMNKMDINGTKKMNHEIYESLIRFGLKPYLILNKVPGAIPEFDFDEYNLGEEIVEIEETLGYPVSFTIPCFCDIQFNRNEFLWAVRKPDHPFSRKLMELPRLLDG